MIEGAYSFTEYTNGFLPTQMDIVDFDFSDGSILQSQTSGRDSSGGVTFTPCNEATGGAYSLSIAKQYTAQQTRIVQLYVAQGAAQGTLGGRLVSFCEAAEDIQGETVQVAINILPDNTLQATRANAQGTGFILRGVDQGVDSQMTLLGTSSATIAAGSYLEIEVFHHGTMGRITVWIDNATTSMWELTNVNTAISGTNSSERVRWGGYASTEVGNDTYHHEDLNATVSHVMVINGTTNPNDANDPTTRIGDHKPLLSLPIADDVFTEYTPDPAQAHFLNVNEVPPDDDTTENETPEVEQRDNFEMDDVTGTGTDQVYLAYTGYVKADTGAACGTSDVPANFQSMIYMVQPESGKVINGDNDPSICAFTDILTHRAETVCTISQDGEAVQFKCNLVSQDGTWVLLSPLSAPPRVLNADGPDRYTTAVFSLLEPLVGSTAPAPLTSVAGQVVYTALWNQPWQGTAVDTQDLLDTPGDLVNFRLLNNAIGVDAVLIDNSMANLYNPYTSPLTGFHFRDDGRDPDPYFWIGPSFAYNGQTLYNYTDDDVFQMEISATDVTFTQNGGLLETIPVTFPLHTNFAAMLGAWGFGTVDAVTGYVLQPGLKDVYVQIGGASCVQGNFQQLSCTPVVFATGNTGPPEADVWGVELDQPFNPGDLPRGDATVLDSYTNNLPGFRPVFGYDTDTQLEFSLVGGNVRLTVTDWVDYADNMTTVVGNVTTYDYARPYVNTSDFTLHAPASGFVVGIPIFPFPALEYDFVNAVDNAPLRFVVICADDSAYSLPEKAGVKETSFTFIEGVSPATFQGFMRDSGVNKDGTEAEVSTATFRYDQSFLATAPDDTTITLDEANAGTHGYTDPT